MKKRYWTGTNRIIYLDIYRTNTNKIIYSASNLPGIYVCKTQKKNITTKRTAKTPQNIHKQNHRMRIIIITNNGKEKNDENKYQETK